MCLIAQQRLLGDIGCEATEMATETEIELV